VAVVRADRIRQAVGGVVAALAVAGVSYVWRLPRAHAPQAVLAVYAASMVVLAFGAWVVFRRVVRSGYERSGRLEPFPLFLEFLVWGLFFAFPCIYNPFNWAWSQSGSTRTIPLLGVTGWICVGSGLLMLSVAFGWLGVLRSCGQNGRRLEVSGPYRLSRNPQIVGGLVLVVGYVVLWPSLYALGWLFLFAFLAHAMVLVEESHLRATYGVAYVGYCQRVSRYLGFPRRAGRSG
jgi:protein-S-isoprenylcysteine O-methyltransferase Ste14